MKIILILLFSVLNGQGFLDYLSGPITLKVGLVSGYDDNVLRFSDIEKRQASENKLIMDGTDTFDSHFSRLYLVGEKKIQLIGRGKYIYHDLLIESFFLQQDIILKNENQKYLYHP